MIGRRPCIKIIFGSAVNSNAKDATDFEIIKLTPSSNTILPNLPRFDLSSYKNLLVWHFFSEINLPAFA